jgi:hypothetical protein
MAKQVSFSLPAFSLPAFSLKRSLRALTPLMAILCFTLETFTSPVYADGQSVRVTFFGADGFASVRLTEKSSECLKLQVTHNLVDGSPTSWWIDVTPNTTIAPLLYTRAGCTGPSRRTDPPSVNVSTEGTTLSVGQTCLEVGQPTSLPNFTLLEDGWCFAYDGYIMANGVAYPASVGGGGPQ